MNEERGKGKNKVFSRSFFFRSRVAYPFYRYCFILMDFSFCALFTFFSLQLLRNHLDDLSKKKRKIIRDDSILKDVFIVMADSQSTFTCCLVEFSINHEGRDFHAFSNSSTSREASNDIKLYVLFSSEPLSVCLFLLFHVHCLLPHCTIYKYTHVLS